MVRELDLKKPPSIAESIDWARALLLLGASDIDPTPSARRCGDRQAPHRPRHGRRAGRVKLDARPGRLSIRRRPATGRATRRLVASARICAPRACAVGTSELLDAFPALQRDRLALAGATSARRSPPRSPSAGGPARLRAGVRPLLLPRHRAAVRARGRREDRQTRVGGDEVDLDELRRADRPGAREGAEARAARPRAAGDRRFGRRQGSGVLGVDVQRIRRALGLRTEPQPELPPEDPRRDGIPREQLRRFEALLRRELERAQIERTGALPPKRPLTTSTARCRAGRLPISPPSTALSPSCAPARHPGHAGPRPPRHAHVDVRAHDARLAADRRRAGRAQVPPEAPTPARDLRALRRLDERHLRLRVLPVGAARPSRHVPQAALVRVHRAHLRGDRDLRSASATSSRQRTRSPATPALPTSPATPTTGACGGSSWPRSRTTCTRAPP